MEIQDRRVKSLTKRGAIPSTFILFNHLLKLMPETFHSFLKTVEGGEGDRCKYPTRCDMYGCGCYHDCSYCYAKSLLEFRKNWNPEEPSVADKKEVLKALDTVEKGTILRLGGMTDPFQPCEEEYHMNRWLIGELNKRGIGYLIVTKGALILEKNMDVLDKNLAHIQISYTYSGTAIHPTSRGHPHQQTG